MFMYVFKVSSRSLYIYPRTTFWLTVWLSGSKFVNAPTWEFSLEEYLANNNQQVKINQPFYSDKFANLVRISY